MNTLLDSQLSPRHPIAGAALENMWHESQASGGLGALEYDKLLEMARRQTHAVMLGLFYKNGYFVQSFDDHGQQIATYNIYDPVKLGLTLVEGLRIVIPLAGGRKLHAQVWERWVGTVRQLLLDTNIDANDDDLKRVSCKLYGGGDWVRVLQELLLGVGGEMAMAALGIRPLVRHLNEGHAWAIVMEYIRQLRLEGYSTEDARRMAWATTIFTSHTPVPAGIDRIKGEHMRRAMDPEYLAETGFSMEELMYLGRNEAEEQDHYDTFNVAAFLLRMCKRVTAVAKLHREASERLFAGITDRSEFDYVTNGVGPQWVDATILELAARGLGNIPPTALWSTRNRMRSEMVAYLRERLGRNDILDENVLTIGFARRVPSYKRLTLVIGDNENDPRQKQMIDLLRTGKLQIVWAGKAHANDGDGKALLKRLKEFIQHLEIHEPDLAKRFILVPDYDRTLAEYMVRGCDMWLNNPIRLQEACGTSYMKVSRNGGIVISVMDGAVPEFYTDSVNGFTLGPDGPAEDVEIAAEFYAKIVGRAIPMFYQRGADGVPNAWLGMVANAIELADQLSAARMMREYELVYLAAIKDGIWAKSLRSIPEGATA